MILKAGLGHGLRPTRAELGLSRLVADSAKSVFSSFLILLLPVLSLSPFVPPLPSPLSISASTSHILPLKPISFSLEPNNGFHHML